MNNMRLSDLCLRLFYVDAVFELLAPWVFPEARYVTKPLLMLLLAGYVGLASKSLLIVLFFAWLGDVFLLIPGDNPLFFQLGLGSFLLMQFAYIRLFHLRSKEIWHWSIGAIMVYVVNLLRFLWPHVNEGLRIPVVVYAVALGAMLYFGVKLKDKVIFWGAFLFVISDSLLALGKFYYAIPGNSFWVMSTYILAQLLLITRLRKLQLTN
jgi:uncharacterized membrane protein YhhN